MVAIQLLINWTETDAASKIIRRNATLMIKIGAFVVRMQKICHLIVRI